MSKRFVAISLGFLLGCCVPRPADAQQSSNQLPIRSPHIAALEKQLKSAGTAALENFWQQVTQEGTPLVEPIPGDDKHVLVTFLWRAKSAVNNVVLRDGPAGDDFVDNQLQHLGATDLWYRTCRIRRDARFYYSFSVNDPLTFPTSAAEWKQHSSQPDPMSHHIITTPKDEEAPNDKEQASSALELPGAPAQPWTVVRPNVPAGAIALHRIKSTLLGNERRVWVYTPAGYSVSAKPCGLVILFDGWLYVRIIPTPTILDNLYAEKRIPPLVAVFVDNFLGIDWRIRAKELLSNEAFANFITKELIPWIHQHYNVTSDPARTIVGGLSAGGAAAAFVALRHPELFGNVLSQSGAFQNEASPDEFYNDPEDREEEHLTHRFAAAPKVPVRFYLEAGLYERFGNSPQGPTLLLANRHFRDVLRAKGYTFRYAEFPSDHSELHWKGTLADGLTFLIGNFGNDTDANR